MRMPIWVLTLATLTIYLCSSATAEERRSETVATTVEETIDWIQKRRTFTMNGEPYGLSGLPLVYYSITTGFNYGAWVEVANYKYRPYHWRVNVQWWLTTLGKRNHHIIIEHPNVLTLPFSLRLMTQDLKNIGANYFGIGNDTQIEQRHIERNPDYYLYLLEQQRTAFDLEANAPLGISLFGGFRFNRAIPTRIDQFEEDYFIVRMPDSEVPGRDAGWSNFVIAGIILDRRDDPDLTMSGLLSEFSYQKAYDWLGSDYLFERFTFLNTYYHRIGQNYVLVNLTVLERLRGHAPFYELTEIGGSVRGFSVGGNATLRGYESRRFSDKQKLLWTTELRRIFDERRFLGLHLQTQWVLFGDMGQVAPNLRELSPQAMHFSGGAGFRATWNAQLTVRVDYAVSPEDRLFLMTFGNLY